MAHIQSVRLPNWGPGGQEISIDLKGIAKPRHLVVTGQPGAGKTRLLEALAIEAQHCGEEHPVQQAIDSARRMDRVGFVATKEDDLRRAASALAHRPAIVEWTHRDGASSGNPALLLGSRRGPRHNRHVGSLLHLLSDRKGQQAHLHLAGETVQVAQIAQWIGRICDCLARVFQEQHVAANYAVRSDSFTFVGASGRRYDIWSLPDSLAISIEIISAIFCGFDRASLTVWTQTDGDGVAPHQPGDLDSDFQDEYGEEDDEEHDDEYDGEYENEFGEIGVDRRGRLSGRTGRRPQLGDSGVPLSLEPSGVVLIDNVDTYLSIEQQRHFLPLLVELFPELQFVVTTRSPAVVASLSDAIVFDAGRCVALRGEELAGVSYAAIAQTHFMVGDQVDLVSARLLAELRALVKVEGDEQGYIQVPSARLAELAAMLIARSHTLSLETWMATKGQVAHWALK